MLLPVTATAIFMSVYLRTSPFPPETAMLHLLAAQSCDMARTLGLAPARRGQPGYHPHNDADHDGTACEPWPPSGPPQPGSVTAEFRAGAKFLRP